MNTGKKYISVTMYDSELKKNITRSIKRDRFDNDDKLKEHISKMKEKQREKNRIYKENNKVIKYTDKLESPLQEIIPINTIIHNNINNFTLDENTGNSTVIFGSSKRGKTTLMVNLYRQFYEKDKQNISTLFTGNVQVPLYKKLDKLLIGSGFNKRSEKYIKLQKYINSKTNNKYHFLNMFDDIIDMKYKSLVNNLILTYRNAYISTIMCLQYTYLLSKMNRANVNNVIIFGCDNDIAIKDVIDTFLKSHFLNMGMKSYKDQYNFFKEITNNYGFFYINNRKNIFTMHRIIN